MWGRQISGSKWAGEAGEAGGKGVMMLTYYIQIKDSSGASDTKGKLFNLMI